MFRGENGHHRCPKENLTEVGMCAGSSIPHIEN